MVFKLHEDLVALGVEAQKSADVIHMLYERLYDHHYVKESFLDAVLEREKVYPTGLKLKEFGIAIPHTDVEHVNQPGIGVAVLNNPVTFQLMGDPEASVDVEVVFLLAVKEPNQQLALLERLMDMFQDDETMRTLRKASSPVDIVTLLENRLRLKIA